MYILERKKYTSLMYTMYSNAGYNTPCYTHVGLYVVRRVHPMCSKRLFTPWTMNSS